MSTYLQLSQRARREMGIAAASAAVPSTVIGQTGALLDVCDYVQRAWIDIQASKPYWKFLRSRFTFSTVIGTRTYDPTAAPISHTDIDKWNTGSMFIYQTSVQDETKLGWRDYDWFTRNIRHGYQSGRPSIITEEPGRVLGFDLIPDQVYTVTVNYWQTPEKLAADGDVPVLPEHYHDIIVWRSVMMWAGRKQAPELYQYAKGQYDSMYFRLMVDQIEVPPQLAVFPVARGNTRIVVPSVEPLK